jgi:hypothetical protein
MWDWEKLKPKRSRNYYSYSGNDSYYKIRKRRAIRNIVVITIIMALLLVGVVFLAKQVASEVEEKRDVVVSKFKEAVQEYRDNNSVTNKDITPDVSMVKE